jgi:5-methylcytosine-specific restriction endonuclease McrA
VIAKPTPKAKQPKPLRSRPRPVDKRAAAAALKRDEGLCQWCRVPGGRLDPHHIQRRSQGGKDVAWNLASVHRLCHAYIHEHPLEAYERHFLIRNGEEVVSWT